MSKIWRVVSFLFTCLLIVGIVVTGVALITGASLSRIEDVVSRRLTPDMLPPEAQQVLEESAPDLFGLEE